jgi:DNA-binding NtrC family response regulator
VPRRPPSPPRRRVLAATSRDLRALIESGAFRRDLYYRLAELNVELPPLRARREDIAALAEELTRTFAEGVTVSHQAELVLTRHDWPGNVRELRNALKRAIALSRGAGVLQALHFGQLGEAGGATIPPRSRAHEATRGSEPPGLVFPSHVKAHSERIWKEGELPDVPAASRNEQRALERAALLCLLAREPMVGWPRALTQHFHRLFGEKWATAEEGRGVRELVRELRMDPRDASARELVMGRVGRG